MSRIHISHIRLHHYFPPNDSLAATVARLCILREDFITEAMGAASVSIPDLDGISPQWRRLYFLRNSIRTVHEIRRAVHALRSNKEFKRALSECGTKGDFEKSYKELITEEKYIRDLRNRIAGGHVLESAVQEGLNKMDPTAKGLIQVGELTKDIRFKFVYNLALATMFPGHGRDPEQEVNLFFKRVGGPIRQSIRIVEITFSTYAKARRLS